MDHSYAPSTTNPRNDVSDGVSKKNLSLEHEQKRKTGRGDAAKNLAKRIKMQNGKQQVTKTRQAQPHT